MLAIGNKLCVTEEFYRISLEKARQFMQSFNVEEDALKPSQQTINKEKSLSLIEYDIPRTFPELGYFKRDGPMYS